MPLSQKTAYPIPDMWNTFGHSYLQFTGGSVDQTGRFDAIFRSSLDIEYTNWRNRAVSGAQLALQGRKLGGFGRVFQENGKNTSRGAPYSGDGGALLMCYGINDMGNNGTGPSTAVAQRTNFIHTMRACISLWRASRVWDDTSGTTLAYGAGFIAGSGTADWSFGNSTRNATALTNANFTITLPADYAGEPVAICFDGASTNGGTVTFSGTAGVTGTFSTSGINNIIFNHSKCIKRITNLTSANAGQTIIATVTALDAGGSVSFDCWWLEAKAAPPVIVCNVARLPAAGYALYASWTGTEAAKDAEVVAMNADINTLVAEFDSMVQVADLDTALNKDVSLFWDGLHPNENGAAKCADACLTAMKRFRPTTALGTAANFNVPSPRQGAIIRARRGGLYYTTEGQSGSSAAMVPQSQYWVPYYVSQGRERYVRMCIGGAAVGTGALSTIRWGIYDDIGWTGYPQNLVVELTTGGVFSPALTAVMHQSPASGTGSLNITLDPGLYWLSVKCITNATSQTWRAVTAATLMMNNVASDGSYITYGGFIQASMGTGALADTAPTTLSPHANPPLLGIQLF